MNTAQTKQTNQNPWVAKLGFNMPTTRTHVQPWFGSTHFQVSVLFRFSMSFWWSCSAAMMALWQKTLHSKVPLASATKTKNKHILVFAITNPNDKNIPKRERTCEEKNHFKPKPIQNQPACSKKIAAQMLLSWHLAQQNCRTRCTNETLEPELMSGMDLVEIWNLECGTNTLPSGFGRACLSCPTNFNCFCLHAFCWRPLYSVNSVMRPTPPGFLIFFRGKLPRGNPPTIPGSPSFCFLSKMTVNLLYLWCSRPLPNSSQGIIPDSSGSLRLQTSARVQARKKAICLQRSIASNRAANNLYRFALNFSNVRWLFSTRHY